MKEIMVTIEIHENGKITADAEGFEGDTCLDELAKLLAELDFEGAVIERKADTGERRANVRRMHRLGRKE